MAAPPTPNGEAPLSGATAPNTRAEPILKVCDIDASHGKIQIQHGVSLDVYPGEIVSVIGPNGAGKSRVLKAVVGILRPSRGEILFGDQGIGGPRTDLVVRHSIGYVPQGRIGSSSKT